MPSDQFSTLLRILEMADGNDDNTWGDNTNTNLNLLEQAIAKQTQLTLSQFTGNQYTLTTLDGQADDSRAIGITLTGALTANVEIIFPNIARLMVFNNQCTNNLSASNPNGFTVTLQTSSPSATAIVTAGVQTIFCDAAENIYQIDPPAARLAVLDEYEQFQVNTAWKPFALTFGNTINIDPSVARKFSLILTGTPTNPLTFTAGNSTSLPNGQAGLLDGTEFDLLLVQDATGSRTVQWPTNVKWPNDVTPTLTAVGNGADLITMKWFAGSATWFGSIQQGYNPSGTAGTQHTINIIYNQVDWQLAGQIPGLTGTPTVNINVLQGIIVEGSSINLSSLNLANSGLPSGSIINLFVSGSVVGKGGDGGDGGYFIGDTNFGIGLAPRPGQHGGTAIIGPGAGYTFNLTVQTTGKVLPGGGGGGGGGWTAAAPAAVNAASGGGGAGAGGFGGKGGKGYTIGQSTFVSSTDGGDSAPGPNSTPGSGGNGAQSGTASAGSGGAGGAFGAAGTVGTSPTGDTVTQAGATFGAGGWSVNNNNVSYTQNILGVKDGSDYAGSGTQNYPFW
jgi:hypothetical protein